ASHRHAGADGSRRRLEARDDRLIVGLLSVGGRRGPAGREQQEGEGDREPARTRRHGHLLAWARRNGRSLRPEPGCGGVTLALRVRNDPVATAERCRCPGVARAAGGAAVLPHAPTPPCAGARRTSRATPPRGARWRRAARPPRTPRGWRRRGARR